jgi:hypothetical protein
MKYLSKKLKNLSSKKMNHVYKSLEANAEEFSEALYKKGVENAIVFFFVVV